MSQAKGRYDNIGFLQRPLRELAMPIVKLYSFPVVLLVAAIGMTACGTPQPVKNLSKAQIEAIEAAIENSSQQGQAIIKLAQKLKEKTLSERAREREAARAEAIEELVVESDRKKALNSAFDAGKERSQSAVELEATLNAKITKIKELTNRLTSLLNELRSAQIAIHQFLETEALGEQLGKSILGNPLMSKALGTVSRFIKETLTVSRELGDLIDSLIKDSVNNKTEPQKVMGDDQRRIAAEH